MSTGTDTVMDTDTATEDTAATENITATITAAGNSRDRDEK